MTDITSVGWMPVAGRLGIFSRLANLIRIHFALHRTVRALERLDDVQFRDIGLERYEIRSHARSVVNAAYAGLTRAP